MDADVRVVGAGPSLALGNLRAVVIVVVVAFHSVLAYLGSLAPSAFPFDASPYRWRAFPIVDSHRWFGFDVFCAWQDVYLMALMFFLAGLFTWPSLARKRAGRFLGDRVLRLGVPFIFALTIVMPLALYPTYQVTAVDPGVVAYGRHYLALPFWPNGPMWFLWLLLGLSIAAAALHRFAGDRADALLRRCATLSARRIIGGLMVASALAYVPMALIFTPFRWSEHGPLALQFSRPLLYAVYYFAGLGVGAYGLGRGLLAPGGWLASRWGVWLALALASLLLWMGLSYLAMADGPMAAIVLQAAVGLGFAMACTSSWAFMLATCLRFGTLRSRVVDALSNNAFGIYLLHYLFVVWLQFALLDVALVAIAKAAIVFAASLGLAWAGTALLRLNRFGCRLIGEAPGAPCP